MVALTVLDGPSAAKCENRTELEPHNGLETSKVGSRVIAKHLFGLPLMSVFSS